MPEISDPVRIIKFEEEVASPGLESAVFDSLAYRVAELEAHFHNWESWFGLASTPNAEIHRGDRIGPSIAAFVLTAGNNNWGAWVQLLGSSDTPARAGTVYFDCNQIVTTAVSLNGIFFVQIAAGATAAGALAAGDYTENVLVRTNVLGTVSPVNLRMRRKPSGTKVWARMMVPGGNALTMNIYIGIHEYTG